MVDSDSSPIYITKLRHWLTDGDRYVLSFPDKPENTRKRLGKDKPDPNVDPTAAYIELTERLRAPTPQNVSLNAIMGTIDHSLLGPTMTAEQLAKGYETAKSWSAASVCINNDSIDSALKALAGTGVAVGAVISFPFGRDATAVKATAAYEALKRGATEIDMPINISQMLSGQHKYVYDDLLAVWDLVHSAGGIFKPIARVDDMQTAWGASKVPGEDNPHIAAYCQMINRLQQELPGGFHQIMAKTSTGYDYQGKEPNLTYAGATDDVLATFAKFCPPNGFVGRKAAGKVRSAADFLRIMENFGVVRIGCTTTEKIADELSGMGYKGHYKS